MKNLKFIVRDELNEEYLLKEFTVPDPAQLTRDEVEAFKDVLFRRIQHSIPEEALGWYWEEMFVCKTDIEEEEERRNALYEEYLIEYDNDEDAAWEALCDTLREERGII